MAASGAITTLLVLLATNAANGGRGDNSAPNESLSRSFAGAITTRENYKSTGCILKTVVSSSHISCAQTCLMRTRCVATNFESASGLCQLSHCGAAKTAKFEGVLQYRRGFIYSEYIREGCHLTGCKNGGTCVFSDKSTGRFHCYCDWRWTGEYCEIQQKEFVFRFTNLGSAGKDGPSSSAAYKSTPLESVQIKAGIQDWLVPYTGQYSLTACGAAGGDGNNGVKGGKGAEIRGEMSLTKGARIRILVGQKGQSYSDSTGGSGGGGTFIVANSSAPLAIAGGGGGGGTKPGEPGQSGKNGSVFGGSDGAGGKARPARQIYRKTPDGGSGGGLLQDGCCFSPPGIICTACDEAGRGFQNGGAGGQSCRQQCQGGFGGGGASRTTPGGGGGFSGGGATEFQGGGGGSFKMNDTWTITAGVCDGDGYVVLKYKIP